MGFWGSHVGCHLIKVYQNQHLGIPSGTCWKTVSTSRNGALISIDVQRVYKPDRTQVVNQRKPKPSPIAQIQRFGSPLPDSPALCFLTFRSSIKSWGHNDVHHIIMSSWINISIFRSQIDRSCKFSIVFIRNPMQSLLFRPRSQPHPRFVACYIMSYMLVSMGSPAWRTWHGLFVGVKTETSQRAPSDPTKCACYTVYLFFHLVS